MGQERKLAVPSKKTLSKQNKPKSAQAESPKAGLSPAKRTRASQTPAPQVKAEPARSLASKPKGQVKAKGPLEQESRLTDPAAVVASGLGQVSEPEAAVTGVVAVPVVPVATPPVDAQLAQKLSQEPPRALNSPIRIFQIYFEGWQRELLDPAFYPLDNSRNTSELMEFNVFDQLQRNPATQGAALWGALSWKFAEKTGMTGAQLVKQIVDHPGHDVYFCNPHINNEALYHNMWVQGEVSHPQFLELCRLFYAAAELDEKELTAIEPSGHFSAANYFVATPKFWSVFIPFVKKVLVKADKRLDPKIRDLLHSKVADDKALHAGATYIPFIVERLFNVFMRTEGQALKAYKVALPERERELNVHLKLLREMKDVAHKTQSAWLAACWVNYRNLYMSQTNGKPWCDKYLRAITPMEVKFSPNWS